MDFGKVKRIGNFSVLKYKERNVSVIKVSAVSNNWSVSFSESHFLFTYINNLETEEDWKVLNLIAVSWFGVCTIVEKDFTANLYKMIDDYVKRNIDLAETTEEENKEGQTIVETEERLQRALAESQEKTE